MWSTSSILDTFKFFPALSIDFGAVSDSFSPQKSRTFDGGLAELQRVEAEREEAVSKGMEAKRPKMPLRSSATSMPFDGCASSALRAGVAAVNFEG